jgi:hypothetical protein
MRYAKTTLLAAALALVSCLQFEGTELPINFVEDRTAKFVGEAAVRVFCSIDTGKYNPLNALDYTLGENGPPYFDYVAVGTAGLKRDSRGVYIDLPPDLYTVLERRFTYIVPLQKQGIKVLLGIAGARDGVSFGTITDDERKVLAYSIVQILELYSLDGVELNDANAAKSAADFPWPEGDFIAEDGTITTIIAEDPDKALQAWTAGGDRMTDLIWSIREDMNASLKKAEEGRKDSMVDSLNLKIIIVREENYGKYLREDVPSGYFISRDDQLNFVVNPAFDRFGSREQPGDSILFNLKHTQYGPLAIDLDGAAQDLRDFSNRFAEAKDYGLIFYQNLKPTPTPEVNREMTAYMSVTSRAVFGKDVVCANGGGNYQNYYQSDR